MFHRGQLCELDFQILDHKQSRRLSPPKKILIRFTPLRLYMIFKRIIHILRTVEAFYKT